MIYFAVIILLHEKMDKTPDIKITNDITDKDNVFTFEYVETTIYMFFDIIISIVSLIITISIILQINNRILQRYNFMYEFFTRASRCEA